MSEDSGAERSHEATPKKLEQAREKGEVIKSQDIMVASSYLGLLMVLILGGGFVAKLMVDTGGMILANADRISPGIRVAGGPAAVAIFQNGLWLVIAIVGPVAGLVLAALFAQRAIVFAPTKLVPKMSRISILANAKNKFGPTGLFEFGKSALKMASLIGLLAYFFTTQADRIVGASQSSPSGAILEMSSLLTEFMIFVLILSALIATVDYGWQRHSFLARNRMTRQEVLDEAKQSEGDPHLKARRRQRGQEIAMNGMLADVPDASVVIVNPTHYAVALKWSPTDPTPPVCVAKGVDHVAARIREIAAEHDIPIFSDPPTARALFAETDLGDPIERAHFAAVAAAIRFARNLRDGGAT